MELSQCVHVYSPKRVTSTMTSMPASRAVVVICSLSAPPTPPGGNSSAAATVINRLALSLYKKVGLLKVNGSQAP